MPERKVAQGFPPGEYLRDYLEAREWSQAQFSDIVGCSPRLISEVITSKRRITPEVAKLFATALGTSAELWMNLDSAYQLWKSGPVSSEVAERTALRSKFPVRDMINRKWIPFSDSTEVLQSLLLRHFEIKNINETPRFAGATKKRGNSEQHTPNQLAWVYRVKHIAETMPVPPYSKRSLVNAIGQLERLKSAPEEIRHVPQILADSGVRFVIVEPLPSSMIYGVCLWLGSSPVIGMSLTYDRIDNFWFVLRHEIEHALNGDGKDYAMIDVNLSPSQPVSEGLPEEEQRANSAAAEFCVPQNELNDFLARNQSLLYRNSVLGFASRLQIHPGIVVGQIQRKLNRFDLFRPMLAPIRSIVIQTAMTDGYGHEFAMPG